MASKSPTRRSEPGAPGSASNTPAGCADINTSAGDKWHLDEVFVKIGGVREYIWRAVDQDGNVLDILIQSKRDGTAATRFVKKMSRKH